MPVDPRTMNSQHDANAAKHSAALFSLFAALGLTCLKLAAGLYTNSLGILFEALHSGLDLLAAGMTLVAVRIAARPSDAGHPYGHGKIENLAALAETVLLLCVCIWAAYEGVQRLVNNARPPLPSLLGVGAMVISIAVDVNRVHVLRRVVRRYKSYALKADALHFSTDILSSAVVLAGVLAVWLASALKLPESFCIVLGQADTVAALIVALVIVRASFRMAAQAINTLMDSGSEKEAAAIVHAIQQVPGITSLQRLRLRSSGAQTFVDMTVGVDPDISVNEGHKLAHKAEQAVAAISPDSDVTVHVEPCGAAADQDKPGRPLSRNADVSAVTPSKTGALQAPPTVVSSLSQSSLMPILITDEVSKGACPSSDCHSLCRASRSRLLHLSDFVRTGKNERRRSRAKHVSVRSFFWGGRRQSNRSRTDLS